LERQTYRSLQRDSGLSKDTLQRLFYRFLNEAPVTPLIHHDYIHLRVDATYFKKFCVVCYQDNIISYTQLFRFSDAERYEEIKEDLLESYFGHLKNHLDLHRGLTKKNRINFIKWYIYFRNKSRL
jgi:hypothetical protein